jgi:alanine racemase
MKPDWTLGTLGHLLGASLHGEAELPVSTLATDSRTLAPSPGMLFVALTGIQHNGHDYIRQLYQRGIRAFLVSRLPDISEYPEAGFCLVEDTLLALQELAAARRRQFKGEVLAITGSNGKTIVKEWIHHCLADLLSIHRSPKSYNSQVGVPLSVWGIETEHQLAVIEAGISRPGEMKNLQRVILPDTGIFTHFGTAHQEHFINDEAKLREKLLLFRECKKVICRADRLVNSRPISSYLKEFQVGIVDWSLEGPAMYCYRIIGQTKLQTRVEIQRDGEPFTFKLPFSDEASLENALHVISYCLERGIPPASLKEQIEVLEPVSMRLEILQGIMGSTLINDSYNSDIVGVMAALDLMGQQESHKGKVLILSDLFQSGKKEEELYSEIAALLETKQIDDFIGIGKALSRNRSLFPLSSLFYPDTESYIKLMDRTLFQEKTVLIKGSRPFGFERITRELQLKTHQTRLETDLNAMVHNLTYFRSLLGEGVLTMVMVKALSYGSGNIEIAKLLQYHQVDYLAVAFIDEGVELRKAGIHLPIMVLNPDPSGFGAMLDFSLEPELYNFRGVQALQKVLHQKGIKRFPVHVKLDTGMHRLGFGEGDLEQLIPLLREPGFRLMSVFSHLAASGNPGEDAFTRMQIKLFDHMCSTLKKSLGKGFMKHILNSAGIERFPHAQYDMVRLGIGLHGIGEYASLRVVSSFLTTISQIRAVGAGETVGYDRSGITREPTTIATIPVGYADGFHRSLGKGAGHVFVNGSKAPTIGEICMDMTMIDISGIEASEGDDVEIFGKLQPVSELARQAGTIAYELLTSVPERVKRVYMQE